MSFSQAILDLTRRLYPSGRAFRIPFGGVLEKVHKALAVGENAAYTDAISILDGILPDNPNFTAEDAEDWERRLGLIINNSVALEDRKAAIARKMNHPGQIKARQHYLYLERELRAANFDVYVHENRFQLPADTDSQMGLSEMGVSEMGGETGNESTVALDPASFLGLDTEMGVAQMGVSDMGGFAGETAFYEIIANHIEPELDADFFDVGLVAQMGSGEMGVEEMGRPFDFDEALKSTFFIGGQVLGSFASIPANRYTEFRQLVLKVKPAQTIAFAFLEFSGPDYNGDYNDDFSI